MIRCPRCQRRLLPSKECPEHGVPSGLATDVVQLVRSPELAPPGWRIGPIVAEGGTARVFAIARDGQPPSILKLARWREHDIRARFEREVDVLRAVGPPAVPAYREHGALDGWPYIVMEQLAGETLAAWMANAGERGGLGEILAIAIGIATALAAVHARGYVHRDLKPENVMIGPGGIRLLDFGLAKPIGGAALGVTKIGAVVGTAHYLAPEQIKTGGMVDQRADIYSFGVVLFELIAGRPPFVGDRRALEYQHLAARAPAVGELRAVPAEIDELVRACMAKQPELRPASADELRARASHAVSAILAIRRAPEVARPSLGARRDVVLAWVVAPDLAAAVRALARVQALIVRHHGAGVVAAFAPEQHDDPLAVALEASRTLAGESARVAIHAASALVRRTSQGRIAVYGDDVDRVERWAPARPFVGVVLTEAAARLAAGARADPDLPGFHRDRAEADVARGEPSFVGRDALVRDVVAAATRQQPVAVAITGSAGAGKTRLLVAIADRLRGRDVIAVRGQRRFVGDRYDDDLLVSALGGGASIADALADVGRRRAIVVVDDVHHFSAAVHRALLGGTPVATCIVSSERLLVEVAPDDPAHVAIALPPLPLDAARALVRGLLAPATLLPEVLVDRLAVRGAGNPRLLVALARDIRRRGAIRRGGAGDDWYVAADELDTLLAPPGPSWLAEHALAELSPELASVARACAALGPRFYATEVDAVVGTSSLAQLAALVAHGTLVEHGGWYEFADGHLQRALYDHVLDDRAALHLRALRFWLDHRDRDLVGWLARVAWHASGAGQGTTAAGAWIALARAAVRRGDLAQADDLLARANACLADALPGALATTLASER